MALSIDTLNYDAVAFVRDLLRNNLTDLQSPARSGSSWIFKSIPEEREWDPPIVIVETGSSDRDVLTFTDKLRPPSLIFNIRVYASKIDHRDKLGDEIVKVLSNSSSTNSSGVSIKANQLRFKSSDQIDEDGYIGGYPRIMRIKRLRTEFVFKSW